MPAPFCTPSDTVQYQVAHGQPHSNDVLVGRGVICNNHVGNQRFRALVAMHMPLYQTSHKSHKRSIVGSIVASIRSSNPPGRFLAKDEETGLYQDVGEQLAIKKTLRAFSYRQDNNKGAKKTTECDPSSVRKHEPATRTPAKPAVGAASQVQPIRGRIGIPVTPEHPCCSATSLPPSTSAAVVPMTLSNLRCSLMSGGSLSYGLFPELAHTPMVIDAMCSLRAMQVSGNATANLAYMMPAIQYQPTPGMPYQPSFAEVIPCPQQCTPELSAGTVAAGPLGDCNGTHLVHDESESYDETEDADDDFSDYSAEHIQSFQPKLAGTALMSTPTPQALPGSAAPVRQISTTASFADKTDDNDDDHNIALDSEFHHDEKLSVFRMSDPLLDCPHIRDWHDSSKGSFEDPFATTTKASDHQHECFSHLVQCDAVSIEQFEKFLSDCSNTMLEQFFA